jgi:outer membrane usher protein
MSAREIGHAIIAVLFATILMLFAIAPRPALAAPSDQVLLLAVVVNGYPIDKIGQFVLDGGGLFARREELRDLGFRIPDAVAATGQDLIALSDLPDFSQRLDQPMQTLCPSLLAVGRAVIRPVGLCRSDDRQPAQHLPIRLDTTYVYSDPATMRRYRAGDFIGGFPLWTRPVRLGGALVSSDFSMRPDLVTFPVPAVGGSVAVPSTVDVLVNGSRVLSSQVEPGPFQVPQFPIITGAGTVAPTVTNALGQ